MPRRFTNKFATFRSLNPSVHVRHDCPLLGDNSDKSNR